ncbi:MAG: hypothetical protein ACJA09_002103 [Alcanivorax sp.]|jgi:hypothetical protein
MIYSINVALLHKDGRMVGCDQNRAKGVMTLLESACGYFVGMPKVAYHLRWGGVDSWRLR